LAVASSRKKGSLVQDFLRRHHIFSFGNFFRDAGFSGVCFLSNVAFGLPLMFSVSYAITPAEKRETKNGFFFALLVLKRRTPA
jgi:hypothetical protein